MTEIGELRRPPEYEIRANIFSHHVRAAGLTIRKRYAHEDIFDVSVSKAFEDRIRGMDLLTELLGDMDVSGLGESAPRVMAAELDIQSASRCEIEVYASCTSAQPLREFLAQVEILAEQQRGILDPEFMPGLSTDTKTSMINRLDSEAGESMFVSHLYFAFE